MTIGYNGKTEIDKLRADMIVWMIEDIAYPLEVYQFFTTDPEKKVNLISVSINNRNHKLSQFILIVKYRNSNIIS